MEFVRRVSGRTRWAAEERDSHGVAPRPIPSFARFPPVSPASLESESPIAADVPHSHVSDVGLRQSAKCLSLIWQTRSERNF